MPPFLDFVQRIYDGLQATVQAVFSDKAEASRVPQAAQLQHLAQATAHVQAARAQAHGAQTSGLSQNSALGQAAQAALAKQAAPGQGQLPALPPGQQPTVQHAAQLTVATNTGAAGAATEQPPTLTQMVSTGPEVGDPSGAGATPRVGASGVLTKSTESFKVSSVAQGCMLKGSGTRR